MTDGVFFPRYSLFSYTHHPSPNNGGLNSGMMLMNLEGLRKSHWMKSILAINDELSKALVFGDQVNYLVSSLIK